MRGRISTIYIALALLMASCLPAMAQGSAGPAPAPEAEWQPKRVTLDLKGVPLDDAIKLVIAETDLSVLVTGKIPEEPRVTMRLAESDPIGVLQLLSRAGSLTFAVSPYASSGESGVVLLAAEDAVESPRATPRRTSQSTSAPEAAHRPALAWSRAMPAAQRVTIDLDLNDTPFRDAVAEIVKQIPADDRARIVVDDSVPEDLRVTARVRKMKLTWILDSIVEQADLTYGTHSQRTADALHSPRQSVVTVYIVPKPELRVSSGDKK